MKVTNIFPRIMWKTYKNPLLFDVQEKGFPHGGSLGWTDIKKAPPRGAFFYVLIIAHQADDLAENCDLVNNDRCKRVVLRLQTEVAVFFVEGFDRCFVVDQGNDHIAVFRDRRTFGDDDVAVEDPGVQHAFTADMQGEQGLILGSVAGIGYVGFHLLHSKDRQTGGDSSQQRHMLQPVALADKADRTFMQRVAGDVAFFFQRVQQMLHSGGGRYAAGFADLCETAKKFN